MDKFTFPGIIAENGLFVDGDWVESKDQDKNGDVRLIQLADIGDGYFIDKSNRYLTSQKAKELKCTFLQKGDILLARMPDPLGRACVFPGLEMPCVTVVDVCIIRPDPIIVDTAYLKYLINSPDFRKKIQKYITGTTRQRISRGNLSKINFHLPPIEAQHRIVKILDLAQSLIEKRKQAISYLDDYIKAVFLDMFGDPVSNPKGWEAVKFEDICKIEKEQISPVKIKSSDYYIGLEDIEKRTGMIIKTSSSNSSLLKSAKFVFTKENVLYGKLRPYLNKVALPERSGICSTDILPLMPIKDKSQKHFICYLVRSDYFVSQMINCTVGANLPRVNSGSLNETSVYSPPIALQNQFSELVQKIESLKQKMQSQLKELEDNFQAELQRAFRGE